MKRISLFLYFSLIYLGSIGQLDNVSGDTAGKDSYPVNQDTLKVRQFATLSDYYSESNKDSSLYYSQATLLLSTKLNYQWGIGKAFGSLCRIYTDFGNYAIALDYGLRSLRIFEKLDDPIGLANAYSRLGHIARYQRNLDEALRYYRKALVVDESIKDPAYKAVHLSNISTVFLKLNLPDSALKLAESAYGIWREASNQKYMGRALLRIAEAHSKLGNEELATVFCKMGIKQSLNVNNVSLAAEGYAKLSEIFLKSGLKDSALVYAQKSWLLFNQLNSKTYLSDVSGLLARVYKSMGNLDSAFKYQLEVTAIKDSLADEANSGQLQNLAFEEKMRQQEIAATELKAKEERKQNIQYAAIVIGLITFIILFLLLSRSIIVKTKFIEFFGVLGLLAVFEFINLIIHPYLAHATNDSPVLMLGVLIAIGALLIPLHHKLEKWITKIMVEKNKKIRLAAAKKTIATLES